MSIVPCIACGKILESAIPDGIDGNQPYEGTAFMTNGHYGSTVFDPMDGTWLEINVCDSCLRIARAEGKVLFARPQRQYQPPTYSEWTDDESQANGLSKALD